MKRSETLPETLTETHICGLIYWFVYNKLKLNI
ncbi:hypothetical protein EAPG_00212 [Escherichia albertii B156]|nr:hypothetical protein EAPG_00212 [Escherichia albertii B156]